MNNSTQHHESPRAPTLVGRRRLRVKAGVKVGGFVVNRGLRVKTQVKAGGFRIKRGLRVLSSTHRANQPERRS